MTLSCSMRLIKFTALVVSFSCTQLHGQDMSDLSALEQELVKDAQKNIDLKLSNKTGTLERIACRYKKVPGSNQLSASVNTLYVDYRKAAESQNYEFKSKSKGSLEKCDSNQTIEIIYKPIEKNQVTLVQYKNNRRSCKCVTIS